MSWEILWDYFGDFDDREFVRWLAILTFLFCGPIAVGLWAKTIAWAARQVAHCRKVLGQSTEPPYSS